MASAALNNGRNDVGPTCPPAREMLNGGDDPNSDGAAATTEEIPLVAAFSSFRSPRNSPSAAGARISGLAAFFQTRGSPRVVNLKGRGLVAVVLWWQGGAPETRPGLRRRRRTLPAVEASAPCRARTTVTKTGRGGGRPLHSWEGGPGQKPPY